MQFTIMILNNKSFLHIFKFHEVCEKGSREKILKLTIAKTNCRGNFYQQKYPPWRHITFYKNNITFPKKNYTEMKIPFLSSSRFSASTSTSFFFLLLFLYLPMVKSYTHHLCNVYMRLLREIFTMKPWENKEYSSKSNIYQLSIQKDNPKDEE